MTRYFFDLSNGQVWVDEEGVDLPDLETAKLEAARYLAEMLREHHETFSADGEWQLSVRDDSGLSLFTFTLFMSESPAVQSSSATSKKTMATA